MVRAKFYVESVEHFPNSRIIKMRAVTGKPGEVVSEDRYFWKAIPNGQLTMQIDNPEAWLLFEPGKEVYLDFHEPAG